MIRTPLSILKREPSLRYVEDQPISTQPLTTTQRHSNSEEKKKEKKASCVSRATETTTKTKTQNASPGVNGMGNIRDVEGVRAKKSSTDFATEKGAEGRK